MALTKSVPSSLGKHTKAVKVTLMGRRITENGWGQRNESEQRKFYLTQSTLGRSSTVFVEETANR
jgi:hypothetical protein